MKKRLLIGTLFGLPLDGMSAHSVIVSGGEGPGNTVAPTSDTGAGVPRQPPNTRVFGHQIYSVGLSGNNRQIVSRAAIQEPARVFMAGVGTRLAIRMIHVWGT